MQVVEERDPLTALERAVAQEVGSAERLDAWRALLEAHATLVRKLETDLENETGLALADFDVLAQLALAGGQLRMSELASRALISRSGMTRRAARLAAEGLIERCGADSDARGVVVKLSNSGLDRLVATAPIHARGIRELFLERLSDVELATLESTLRKVRADCSFG